MDAVRPDDGIGLDMREIRKCQPKPGADAIDADELLVEMNGLREIDRCERPMQIGAMQGNVGSAEAPLDLGSHGVQIGYFAGIPVAIVPDIGREAGVADVRFEPEAAQHLHGVRVHLNSGADPREGGRLLVNVGRDADFSQGRRRAEACDAGADDGDRRLSMTTHMREMPQQSGGKAAAASEARPIDKEVGLGLLLVGERRVEFLGSGLEFADTGKRCFKALIGCRDLCRNVCGAVAGTDVRHGLGIVLGAFSHGFVERRFLAPARLYQEIEGG